MRDPDIGGQALLLLDLNVHSSLLTSQVRVLYKLTKPLNEPRWTIGECDCQKLYHVIEDLTSLAHEYYALPFHGRAVLSTHLCPVATLGQSH